jgi:hypothetical protein
MALSTTWYRWPFCGIACCRGCGLGAITTSCNLLESTPLRYLGKYALDAFLDYADFVDNPFMRVHFNIWINQFDSVIAVFAVSNIRH